MDNQLISGLIISRRDHGKALVFLTIERILPTSVDSEDVTKKDSSSSTVLTQIILSKRDLSLADFGKAATFTSSILPLKPGTELEAEGIFSLDRDSRPSLTASRVKVIKCRADPVSVEQFVKAAFDQVYESESAARALCINKPRLDFALTLYAEALADRRQGMDIDAKKQGGGGGTFRQTKKKRDLVDGQSKSDNHINSKSYDLKSGDGKITDKEEEAADQWCSDDDDDDDDDIADNDGGRTSSNNNDRLLDSIVSPRITFKRELIKLARRLSGLAEDRQPRNRARKFEAFEMEALERSESILRSCGQLLSVDELDANTTSIDADAWSSFEISAVHPRRNIPEHSLLDGKTGSSDFAQRSHYLEEKKAPQIAWLLRELGKCRNGSDSSFKHVLDIGGGRADLSLAIASMLPSARVSIIDRNAASLDAGRERAEALGLHQRVRFFDLDVCDLIRESSSSVESVHPALEGVDLFVGLHACGGLTDRIIELAVQHSAAFIVVPCCFCRSDPLGVGFAASAACAEIGIAESDRLALCTLCETAATEATRPISVRAMSVLNASRLSWAHNKRRSISSSSTTTTTTFFKSSLSSFSISYSPRNQVLISA